MTVSGSRRIHDLFDASLAATPQRVFLHLLGADGQPGTMTFAEVGALVDAVEAELRERLAEAERARFAFQTLAANGKLLGIHFEDRSEGRNEAEIDRAFTEFQFSDRTKAVFSASLKH